MKTLKVNPENLEVGKMYLMESKNRDFQAFIKIIQIDEDEHSVYVFNDGHKDVMPYETKWYTFYSVPDDFEFRWNQYRSRFVADVEYIYATMFMKDKGFCVSSIRLDDGHPHNLFCKSEFSDIPDEPETITISGKTYNLDEVTKRIKELKPMEKK